MSVMRGGQTLKEGYIGRNNILRQQILMPGERMDVRMKGKVRMETLRERDAMRIHATLNTFIQPCRWLDGNWVDYIKNQTGTPAPAFTGRTDLANLGIGGTTSPGRDTLDIYEKGPIQIHNMWFKWPEDADITVWPSNGSKAVPLSSAWNRARYTNAADTSYDVASATSDMHITDLAEAQAEFRSLTKKNLTFGRWQEYMQLTWNADGSREVDKVPILIDSTEVGVNPREVPATDGASLGQWQSIYDFDIDHSINQIIAPEHMLVTYILTVRFSPMVEGLMPLANNLCQPWEHAANPEYIESYPPQQVQSNQVLADTTGSFTLGYLPAGWQWRCEHDVIGNLVETKNTFAYMNVPTTQAEAKDATRVKSAFRSSALGDYYTDVYFTENCYQPIGTARDSYFAGMLDHTKHIGNSNDEFPFGGKML
jgi:hypothetical protein